MRQEPSEGDFDAQWGPGKGILNSEERQIEQSEGEGQVLNVM